ncbi:hypothetical protein KDU71_02860 [Carboxylicivirga sediminis]|uniref:HTH luxR-type domain-containing protein n=1 Tax=Carboxylicivirga sediminis TaxID=2006564 RepID=A0A941EZZ6_9BACT|nr:triple tyrosine motif-containing protein [Carboxylicivirga sediminis]MBR8534486.1 hypothetical protein [Carboxylicivirga sediminis]
MMICKQFFRSVAIIVSLLSINFSALQAANKVNNILKDTYGGFSKNWSVDFDERGIVYVGNEAGLLQFDGNTWQLYKTPGQGSVRSVLISGERIYTGSFEEFGYWEANAWGNLKYTSLSDTLARDVLHNDMIWKIVHTQNDEVIFQAFNTLYIYKNDTVTVHEIGSGIIFLSNVRNRIITQKTRGNIIEFSNSEFAEVAGSKVLNRAYTRVFLPFGSEQFLLGSAKKGLYIWDGKSQIREWECEAQQQMKDYNINAGAFDGNFYYIGTLDKGIFKINKQGQVVEHLNVSNGLESNTIHALKCDRQKRLWVALNKGIACVEFNRPVHYITNNAANWGVVHAAAIYQNKLFVGTNQGVYYHPINGVSLSELNSADFIAIEELKGQVWSLHNQGNVLLCGHNLGTFQIKGDAVKQIADIGGGQNFVSISLEGKDYLLQNSYTSLALFGQQRDGFTLKSILKGFFEPSRSMSIDHHNNIWVSHTRRNEVFKVSISNIDEPLKKERYGLEKGLPQNAGSKVSKLDGRIIFTTRDGLFTFDELRDTVVRYKRIEEQLGEYAFANAVRQGGFQSYWFALPPKVALFNINSGIVKKEFEFAFNDPHNSLDEKYPVIVALNDTTTAFGLENGLALVYNSAFEQEQTLADTIYIKNAAYRLDDNMYKLPLDRHDTVALVPYANSRLIFEYMSVGSVNHKSSYWYKLDGYHKNWIKGNPQNKINFTKLPWGRYTLLVKGEGEFGQQLYPVQYSFEIEEPYFAKTWFIICVSILALIILVGISWLINRILKRYHNKLIEDEKQAWNEQHKEEQLRNEEKMIRLKNELLQKEIQHQSTELANRTIATIKRKEVLNEVKQEILKQSEHLKVSYPEKYMNRILRMIDHSIEDEDDWNVFRMHFDKAHEDFFKRLKSSYDDLTPKDLRLCAYLKMNLSTKEIAPLMNVSPRSVEVHRYKIRRKLHLGPNENLTEFMISF